MNGIHPADVPLPASSGRTLGVIVPDLINPVHIEYALEIQKCAQRAGYAVNIENADGDAGREAVLAERFFRRPVDGLFVMSVSTKTQSLYENAPIPTILIGSRTEIPSLDYVVLDDYHAAFLVVSRLSQCGRKRIAFLSFEHAQGYSALDRMNGVRKAIKRSGDPALTVDIVNLASEELRYSCQATERLLLQEHAPNAIVAQNDYIAYGAMQAVAEAGLVPGTDISVIGFDNLLYSSLPKMLLSTVSVAGESLPRRAFSMMERRLSQKRTGRRTILLAPQLIYRDSFPGVTPC